MISGTEISQDLWRPDFVMKGFAQGTELASLLFAGHANGQISSLDKYFQAHEFSKVTLQKLELDAYGPEATAKQTLALHFTLLFSLKCLLKPASLDNELALTFLSSPSLIKVLSRTSFYQTMLQHLQNKEFGLLKSGIKKTCKTLCKKILLPEKEETFPARATQDPVFSREQSALGSLREKIEEEITSRKETALAALHTAASTVRDPEALPEEIALSLVSLFGTGRSLLEFSPSSFFYAVHKRDIQHASIRIRRPSPLERTLSSYSFSQEIGLPFLAPLLFSSPRSDLREMMIRHTCVAAATRYPLLAAAGVEIALKIVPQIPSDNALNQEVQTGAGNAHTALLRRVNSLTLAFEEELYKLGWDKSKVEGAKKVVLQGLSAFLYAALSWKSSPLLVAINTEYFCGYLASFLANYGVARPELLLSKSGLTNLPYKALVGLSFAMLDWMGAGGAPPVLGAACTSLPLVLDAVDSFPAYRRALESFVLTLEPQLASFKRIANCSLLGLKLCDLPFFGTSGSSSLSVKAVGGGIAGSSLWYGLSWLKEKATEALETPTGRKCLESAKKIGQKGLEIYSKYSALTMVESAFGYPTAAVFQLLGEPLHWRTAALAALLGGSAYLYPDSTLALLGTETVTHFWAV